MRSNHDPAIVTLFHSTLEHTLDHFLEFWIFEGVRHFLAIFAQPPTTLLTLRIIMFHKASAVSWTRNVILGARRYIHAGGNVAATRKFRISHIGHKSYSSTPAKYSPDKMQIPSMEDLVSFRVVN